MEGWIRCWLDKLNKRDIGHGNGCHPCANDSSGGIAGQYGDVIVVLAGNEDIRTVWGNGKIARPGPPTTIDANPREIPVSQDAIGGDGIVGTGGAVEELLVRADMNVGHGKVVVGASEGCMIGDVGECAIGVPKYRHATG